MLKGWRTYIIVVVGVLVNGAAAMGYISAETVDMINKFLVFAGLGTIRAGIKNDTQ